MGSLVDDCQDVVRALAGLPWPRPSGRPSRPRVHTLYCSAHRFEDDTLDVLAGAARRMFETYAETPVELAHALGWPADDRTALVHARVATKLARDPIEDVRIDFEDGYGTRSDAEENEAAERTARAVARQASRAAFGLRIKPFEPRTAPRAIETLDRFIGTLVAALGRLPDDFAVTLPKVVLPDQLALLDRVLGRLEQRSGLPPRAIGVEFMLETTTAFFDTQGSVTMGPSLTAIGDRLLGVHFGVYDFTAAWGIAPALQAMDHPVCDLARGLMRLGFGHSLRVLSGGSTHVLPLEPHGPDPRRASDREANRQAVHAAWRRSHDAIRHALERGFDHGWDLHPGQLPIRFATCYRWFDEGFDEAARRLASAQHLLGAALDAAVQDDAATVRALETFVAKAIASGAVDRERALEAGLTLPLGDPRPP